MLVRIVVTKSFSFVTQWKQLRYKVVLSETRIINLIIKLSGSNFLDGKMEYILFNKTTSYMQETGSLTEVTFLL